MSEKRKRLEAVAPLCGKVALIKEYGMTLYRAEAGRNFDDGELLRTETDLPDIGNSEDRKGWKFQ